MRLFFLWLDSQELARKRVEVRVLEGGHHIPPKIIDRRYERGLRNFLFRYRDAVDEWFLFDNSGPDYGWIAMGNEIGIRVENEEKWSKVYEQAGLEKPETKAFGPMSAGVRELESGMEMTREKLLSFKRWKGTALVNKNGSFLPA